MENSVVDAANGVPVGSSVYIDDPNATISPSFVSSITQYNVTRNVLDGDLVKSSGVGFGDNPAGMSLNLTNNEFSLHSGLRQTRMRRRTAASSMTASSSTETSIQSWLGPCIGCDSDNHGKSVDANYTESPTGSRFFAADNSAADLPGLSSSRTTSQTTALEITPMSCLRAAHSKSRCSAVTLPTKSTRCRRRYAPATADGPDGANAGDKVIVQSGSDSSVQTVGNENDTIRALSRSTSLHLSLGSGVSSITLADYRPGTRQRHSHRQ